jgi:hypothetical protein
LLEEFVRLGGNVWKRAQQRTIESGQPASGANRDFDEEAVVHGDARLNGAQEGALAQGTGRNGSDAQVAGAKRSRKAAKKRSQGAA